MRLRIAATLLLIVAFLGVCRFVSRDALGAPPPSPPPPPPPNAPPAGPSLLPPNAPPMALLGQSIFFDASLSNPSGQSCASCHAPAAGFTFPDSNVNQSLGVAPGVVSGRFGNRKVPTINYATFSPNGPQLDPNLKVYVGGMFWDGRTPNLSTQVPLPMLNPNEMNNVGNPAQVVQKIAAGPYASLFKQVFGSNALSASTQQVYLNISQAVAAFESAPAISPFNSKYDAYLAGKAQLNPSELNGLRLATGSANGRPGGPPYKNARCAQCHVIPSSPGVNTDLWTSFAYLNTGVPKNPNNPYYKETNAQTNPLGYNPLGAAYIDFGLGGFLYPSLGLSTGNLGQGSNGKGDFLAVNGTFKTPTLRNADKRPFNGFVKAYMHNGVFKSLEEVVHFYNTRNLTTQPGEGIDFTRSNPYAGLRGRPLWAPPEVPSPLTMRNPTGMPGQIGNLGLTPQEEADVVAFLRTLSDGFFQP